MNNKKKSDVFEYVLDFRLLLMNRVSLTSIYSSERGEFA